MSGFCDAPARVLRPGIEPGRRVLLLRRARGGMSA